MLRSQFVHAFQYIQRQHPTLVCRAAVNEVAEERFHRHIVALDQQPLSRLAPPAIRIIQSGNQLFT